ncbi:hypothetical protein [Komagataeibacter europaeus]|uniref:hypothetical protein n=1 Tax=Komagataeibacter europaeus TaxID=33995 RepID=UPI00030EF852|nr:hypothetical protein [Komagataeibacter europaeus]
MRSREEQIKVLADDFANPPESYQMMEVAELHINEAIQRGRELERAEMGQQWETDIKKAPGLRHTVLVKLKDGRVTMANNEFGPGQDGWVDIVGMQTDIAESDIVAWCFCPDYQQLECEV